MQTLRLLSRVALEDSLAPLKTQDWQKPAFSSPLMFHPPNPSHGPVHREESGSALPRAEKGSAPGARQLTHRMGTLEQCCHSHREHLRPAWDPVQVV